MLTFLFEGVEANLRDALTSDVVVLCPRAEQAFGRNRLSGSGLMHDAFFIQGGSVIILV
jgi:hypothetical protein